MKCLVPTLDKPLMKLFAWYTRNVLTDYYYLLFIFPILLTAILGSGFIWIKDLTVQNAKKLYTPISAPSWKEEQIMREVI